MMHSTIVVFVCRMCSMRVASDVLRVLGAVLGRRADHPVRGLPALAARVLRLHTQRERRGSVLSRWVNNIIHVTLIFYLDVFRRG